ncbi:hypothetical protein [Aquimarina aggregata]|uniref:hypothetical protein n=1 Tax=Aquimarina aggregata TaxID=1642818 RepID=UPI00248F9D51|nr:hypothetical protein [Aquimarina aggregata]
MNERTKYNELDYDTKRMVQEKMNKLFNHTARHEAIKQVLETINPIVNVTKLTFTQMTIEHMMSEIRKWNLTEYWMNKAKH